MGNWISVKDSLPPASTALVTVNVWAYDPVSKRQGTARYVPELGWQFYTDNTWIDSVSHWTPFPDPPEGN